MFLTRECILQFILLYHMDHKQQYNAGLWSQSRSREVAAFPKPVLKSVYLY